MSAYLSPGSSPASRFGTVVRLRQQNEEMRSELRAVNSQLSDLLSSHRKPPDLSPLRSKSLSTVRSQLSRYESQLRSLVRRQQTLSFSTVPELTDTVAALSQAVKEKDACNKATQRLQQSLDVKIAGETPPIDTILDTLSSEIVFKRSQIDHIENKLKKGEEAHISVVDRTQKAEKGFNLLLELGAMDPDYKGRPVFTPDDGHEITETKAKIDDLMRQKTVNEAKFQRKVTNLETEFEKMNKEIGEKTEILREKEKKRRILELKVSEMSRNFGILSKKNVKLSISLKGRSIGSSGNYSFITAGISPEIDPENPYNGRKTPL